MSQLKELLDQNNGVLRLGGKVVEGGRIIKPSEGAGGNYQARFYNHGHRFPRINDLSLEPDGIKRDELENCWDERWLFATNPIEQEGAAPDEGLSWIMNNEGTLLLGTFLDAIRENPAGMLGEEYCARMQGDWTNKENLPMFELLTKLLDIGDYINNHLHPLKDEMYVILQPLNPEFPLKLGYRSDLTETDIREKIAEEAAGNGDGSILKAMRWYRPKPGMSVYVRRGMHHAPVGFVLELQRPLDDFRLIQLYHTILKKQFDADLMLRGDATIDGTYADTNWPMCFFERYEEAFFYEHEVISGCGDDVRVRWVAHPNRSHLWSGKSVEILPNRTYTPREEGPYGLFVSKGQGTVNGLEAEADNFRRDEFVVADQGAKEGITLEAGAQGMTCYLLFPRGVHRRDLVYNTLPKFVGMLDGTGIQIKE